MQKQEATILSCQFPGFLKLVEGLSNDRISELMIEIHSVIDQVTKLHHGKINHFSGEKLLVVFSGTGAKSSYALDAVSEIKDYLKDYTEDKKLNGHFGQKSGLSLGKVLITEFGSGDSAQSSIMGEALSKANRICEFAGIDQILVDENIFNSTGTLFDFQTLEPIPIKGDTESIPVFELTGKKRKKLELKTKGERRIVSEMVGRTREAEQLERLIQNLVNGNGHIINIVGKAGIGKSRLMAEMKVQPILDNVILLEGRARSNGQHLSFHPITDLIRSWAEIAEDDIPAVSSEKLYQSIHGNTPEQSDEIYAFLATMMGLPLEGKHKERLVGIEGEALEKLILKNLRDLIIAATRDRPRIYMIEDMHWSDSSSIVLFESLYKLSQNYPVMFINVMRPGYKETGDYILKFLVDNFPGDHTTINISPLEEKESKSLIKNLLRSNSLPEEIQNMIIRRTEGNPFFIEEIIRSFIDEGIISIKEGSFIITEKIHEVNIPETINDAILSRVDKLDEKTRELLNTASVMGRNFYYKVLEEATDTIEELDERLAYLSEVQLITETKKKEEIEYLFKHALAQQLTYDAIILQSRKGLHQKIAKSIEKVFAENINEFYGTLAYHYESAENWERALDNLIKAGDEAMNSGGSADAIGFYNKALKVYQFQKGDKEAIPMLKSLYSKLGTAYHSRGMSNDAIAILDKALLLFGYKVPRRKIKLLFAFIFNLVYFIIAVYNDRFFFKKPYDPERELLLKIIYNRAQTVSTISPKKFVLESMFFARLLISSDLSKNPQALTIFTGFSIFFFWTGISFKISNRIFRVSERFLIETDSHAYHIHKYMQKMYECHVGNLKKYSDLDHLFHTGMRKGLFWEAAYIMFFNGLCYGDTGDRQKCKYITDKLLVVADQFENHQMRSMYFRFVAYTSVRFREFDNDQLKRIQEGIVYMRKTEHYAPLAVLCSRLSIICTIQGNLFDAGKYLDEAEAHLDEFKTGKPFYSPFLMAKVSYELENIRSEKSLTKTHKKLLLKSVRELIKTTGKFRVAYPEALTLKAKVELCLKKKTRCLKTLKKAMMIADKMGARVELSRIYFETGKFLSDPSNKYSELNGQPAGYYLDKAKRMFEEMDLQWDWLEYRKFQSN